ncbi:hypothetical protein MINTM021_10870 [Mycobacterium paraintracellulare]|nr:hypothetical protein MINTM021_10870 [Mycobacterium paraintracellulare]
MDETTQGSPPGRRADRFGDLFGHGHIGGDERGTLAKIGRYLRARRGRKIADRNKRAQFQGRTRARQTEP